jgi:hypothetical protein
MCIFVAATSFSLVEVSCRFLQGVWAFTVITFMSLCSSRLRLIELAHALSCFTCGCCSQCFSIASRFIGHSSENITSFTSLMCSALYTSSVVLIDDCWCWWRYWSYSKLFRSIHSDYLIFDSLIESSSSIVILKRHHLNSLGRNLLKLCRILDCWLIHL